jgi:glycosyltransferase involved in cell wall biosynthesis
MRILYIYQYFKTREGYGSTRSYEFVRRLRDAGHDVLVVTSTARIPDLTGRKRRGVIEGEIEGIPIHAVPSAYTNRMGFLRRLLEFLRFAWVSSITVLREPRPDLILASSTPLTVALPALAGRLFRGIPLVFEVRDLWPEVPEGMGIIRNRALIAAAKGLAGLTYRKSARIVALSPGMREGILLYRIPPERVVVIPNGSDLDLFHPGMDGSDLRRLQGISEDRFLVVHTGAMGIVNGLDFLIPVCEELARTFPRAIVYLVGEGGQRSRLEALARERDLRNLKCEGPVSKGDLPAWLAAADLGLMLIKRIPILEMNSANKFFDYAAAGLPCLMNYGGWKADLLTRYDAGLAVETDDAVVFAGAIARMAADPDRLRIMGVNTRRMAEAEFDRDKHFRMLEQTLEGALGGR